MEICEWCEEEVKPGHRCSGAWAFGDKTRKKKEEEK